MSGYLWLKLLHILAAIVAVGTNVTYFVWLRLIKARPGEDIFVLDGLSSLDKRLANPASIVLPVTGIAMVLVGDLSLSTLWIAVAIALYVAMGVFAGAFFAPALRRQLQLARASDRDPKEYATAAQRTTITGAATMVLIGAIVYLMVMKPTWHFPELEERGGLHGRRER